jgi:hypothetical protein
MEFSLMKKQMKNARRRRQKVMFQSEMIIAKYGPIEWHHSTFENNQRCLSFITVWRGVLVDKSLSTLVKKNKQNQHRAMPTVFILCRSFVNN